MQAQETKIEKRSLIAYYSRRGYNYVNGEIVDLKIGNTEVVANKIQSLTGSDIFRIETEGHYPEDYTKTTEVAKKEKNENARPEIVGRVKDMSRYDTIYLGYPNWWNTFPMVVFTFLESYDFKGKTIVPFCTHEGSGWGSSVRDIKKLCPESTVLDGLAIRGSTVQNSQADILKRLREIGTIK